MAQRITPKTKMLGGLLVASALSILAPSCPAYITNKAIGASRTLANEVTGGIEERLIDSYNAPDLVRYGGVPTGEDGPSYQEVPQKTEGPMTDEAAKALAILLSIGAAGMLTYKLAHGELRQ